MKGVNENLQKAVVIGSGFGGLAAAIRMQAMGIQTTILEKRDKPGGRAYVYEDQGFIFDAGPTVITAPESIEELFVLAGKDWKDYFDLIPIDPMYRLSWEDGVVFNYYREEEALIEEIRKIAPNDIDGYRRFLSYTEKVFKRGYEDLCHIPFLNFRDMIKIAPDLMKLKAYKSVYGIVSSFMKDWHLRQAFSFSSLLIGGNPFRVSSIYTLIHPLERKWGVFFPKGGTHAMVRGFVKLFEDIGGRIVLDCESDQIVVRDRKVEGVQANGTFYKADYVVSNADVTYTYDHLLRDSRFLKLNLKRKWLHTANYSMSLFVLYFGVNRPVEGITHHNVLFCSRYRELLKDIFDRGTLADDFSLYLHAPSYSDPSLAPEGQQSFYVLSPVPHLGKGTTDWESEGWDYADRILDYLEDKGGLKGIKKDIVTKRIFTPLDFKNELNTHQGSAFSLEPRLTQSAYFRVLNKESSIEGLYFVGSGTHPGAGVPGVIGSAKATASIIEKDAHDWQLKQNQTSAASAIPVERIEV